MCLQMPRNRQNPLSQHAASCVWEMPRGAHCWQGVTWRRVALTKKRGKKQKMRGGEGKLLENCGQKVKKEKGRGKSVKRGKNGRKNGKKGEREEKGGKGRTREKGRLGSREGRRPVTRYRKRRWDNACHVPSTFVEKATMFEPPRKNTKKCGTKQEKCKFEQSEHWFVTTNRPNGTSTGTEGQRCSPLS